MQTCLTTLTTNITHHAPIRPPNLFRRPGDFPHSSPFLETHQLILSVPSASVWKKRTILWGHSPIQPKPGNSDTFVTLLYTFVTGSTANLPLVDTDLSNKRFPRKNRKGTGHSCNMVSCNVGILEGMECLIRLNPDTSLTTQPCLSIWWIVSKNLQCNHWTSVHTLLANQTKIT